MKLFTVLVLPVVAALWPIPSSYSNGSTTLWIAENVPVTYTQSLVFQQYSLQSAVSAADASGSPSQQIVKTALSAAHKTIFQQSYVPWKFHERFTSFEPSVSNKKFVQSIALIQTSPDSPAVLKPKLGQFDEGYTLDVTKAGKVTIKSGSALGLSYGLTTFTQLFYAHSQGGAYTSLAPVSIVDKPQFKHRGFNMDVSRHFFGVDKVIAQIDALAFNKYNRLHLHITDAQSWPLEIPSLPELAAKGAYRSGMTFTPADIQRIYRYGALRGVSVLMEIDQPGHTSSIWYSHPELIAAWNQQPDWVTYSAEPPSGTLKLNSPAVYRFLDKLYADLLPRIAPYTSYFHLGGDEVKIEAYKLDDTVKSGDPNVVRPLLQKYVDYVQKKVRDAGLSVYHWQEIVTDYNLTVKPDVILQVWKDGASAASLTDKGHPVIVGDFSVAYLDCDFEPGEASQRGWPYQDYCAPRHAWRQIYAYDPYSGVAPKNQHLVLGGEVDLWAEQTDETNFDGKAWPRASAMGEILWSGPKDASGQNRSQILASPRLSDMRERLVARGITSEPIQMPFCTMGKEQCVYRSSFDA